MLVNALLLHFSSEMSTVRELSGGKLVCEYKLDENECTARPVKRVFLLSSLWALLTSLFLPIGYPESVTPDYFAFQVR